MDIYQAAIEFAADLPLFKDWPEMGAQFRRAADKSPHGWDLAAVGCLAVGGTVQAAIPGVAALGCLQMAIILIDDILDEDPRGIYREIGAGRAANLAGAFQSAGLGLILKSGGAVKTQTIVLRCLNRMMGQTALGQELDTNNPDNENDYWRLVRAKSSPFYGSALEVGAILGGASDDTAAGIREFGELYGELIQIHDDLKDTMAVPANPDWLQGRHPLPILFAEVVDHPLRARFIELKPQAAEADALREAQTILVRCGAVSYCLDQLVKRCRRGKQLVGGMELADPVVLDVLLEDILEPGRVMVEKLEGAAGADEVLNPGEG